MTSKIKVDNINKVSDDSNIIKKCGTTITLGASGDSIALASGASQTGFGRSGSVNWQTTPKTATFTPTNGEGYFINSGSALTANLPAGSAGAIVAFSDYARNFATYNFTISANGSEKIGGSTNDAILNIDGQAATFVYVDSTKGWVNVQNAEDTEKGVNPFIAATGGTETTCGDFKIHTFTGPGTFAVTCAGSPTGSTALEYILVAGGGGGGGDAQSTAGGGGGAGGFRFASPTLAPATYPAKPLAAPAAITAAVQDYPVSVGGGGARAPGCHSNGPGTVGVNSTVFSLTSAGGGGGATAGGPSGPSAVAGNGGSGGGAQYYNGPGKGSGNTPPVAPPQGKDGGLAQGPGTSVYGSDGGGGALAAGEATTPSGTGGPGGDGGVGGGFPNAFGTSGESSSPFYYFSGGGGGGFWSNIGGYPSATVGVGGLGGGGDAGAKAGPNTPSPGNNATTNTGGGGGGATGGNPAISTGGNGGSGIVIIRYKFQ